MSDAPQNEEAIFKVACQIASSQARAEYLAQVCGGNRALLDRVELLLRLHDDQASFLEGGAGRLAGTLPEPLLERPGTQIGPYKLMEQIGEGGMGLVFVAEQHEPVRRKVALKVIKPGMDTRDIIARFEAERQALALMDHPNIARVLDAGTTASGRPYFVMELVKGTPITQYCDEHRLSPRERLELFTHVCHAIQHAHQKGIIHRDIKPTNVLVASHDGQPVVKVIDFGVAKAIGQQLTERTIYTAMTHMVGTPLYMSPEQAGMSSLDIDTRTDIYSLGVLLYELLTGTTPFDKERLKQAAYEEIRRIIREEEPQKPSTRLSELGNGTPHASRRAGESGTRSMPTTVQTSLASIAALRHTDPAKLTKLLRGELDWIVMKALEKDRNRRYETANGFAMDVQRYLADEAVQACPPSARYRLKKFARRNKAAIATAGLVLFFIVLLGGVVGWGMRDRAAREQEIAQDEARKLALTEQGIRQALDRATTSRVQLHGLLRNPGGVQELLNQVARWDLFLQRVRAELGQAQALRARAEADLDAELTQALDTLQRQLAGDESDRRLAADLEKIRLDSATVVEGKFDDKKAVAEYLRAFASAGIADLENTAALAEKLRASPIKEQLVAALDDWASKAFFLGKGQLAEKVLAVARQTAPDPAWGDRLRDIKVWRDREGIAELAKSSPAELSPHMLQLVDTLLGPNDRSTWLLEARDNHPSDFWLNYNLAHALQASGPVEAAGYYRVALALRPGTAAVYNNLGNTLRAQQKLPEAIAAFHKAIEHDPKLAPAYHGLGNALRDQQKLPEAIAAFHKAIELDPKLAPAYNGLGNTLRAQQKLPEAIAAYRKAIELDAKSAEAYSNLGTALWAQQELPEAIAALHKAIELDPKFAPAFYNLGNTLRAQQKLPEAIAAYRKGIELDPKSAKAYNNLGIALGEQRKLPEAIAAFHKAIELDPKSARAYNNLGGALREQQKLPEAIAAFHKAIELDPKSAKVYNNLGNAHRDQQKLPEAIAAYRKAIELEPKDATAYYNLGNALSDQKKLDEAIAAYRKAIELDPKYAPAYHNLGQSLEQRGDLIGAADAYKAAYRLDPVQTRNPLNNFAWRLATHADPKLRDPSRAAELARCINRDVPNNGVYLNTLGAAEYRAGNFKESITALHKSMEAFQGHQEAFNTFFLAMAHWQLGEKDEARRLFDRAVQWMEEQQPNNEELRRFRVEAEEVLEINAKK